MEFDRNKIKETFLHELQFGIGHPKCDFCEEKMDNIEEALDEICDLSMDIMSHLTEAETFVIRKRLGVYDNGEKQTLRAIAEATGKTHERIRQIENKAYMRIIYSLARKTYTQKDKKTKMSSLSIQEKYADISISRLGIDKKIISMLSYGRIGTLDDLLCYGYEDFQNMGLGKKSFSQLSDKIHSLGLKFIEELTDEEKRMIISVSSKDMIDNSSIAWISNLNKSILSMLSKERRTTISQLREYIENDGKINEDAIIYASSIGINIGKKPKLTTENVEISLEELLDTSIKNIEISTRLFNVLNRHGFKTLRDVVLNTTKQFDILFNQGVVTKAELFDLIHKFGLFFADEAPTMKLYSEEISTQLDTTTNGLKSKEEILLDRYKKLTTEKAQLETRSQELDVELSVVMEQLNSMGKGASNGQSRK